MTLILLIFLYILNSCIWIILQTSTELFVKLARIGIKGSVLPLIVKVIDYVMVFAVY